MTSGLYTAAMLAELVGVHVSRIRSWQRRGWLVPVQQTHRLAYFDFQELTVARQLAELARLGATPKLIEKKLAEIQRRFPDVKRPLAELRERFGAAGKEFPDIRVAVRTGDTPASARARMLRKSPHILITTPESLYILLTSERFRPAFAIFLSRDPSRAPEEAAPQRLAAWAAELDEAGDLRSAAEMYRAALAAGGPRPELCFQLAEVLYRADELSAARERYFMAIELDEDYVEARVNLGCVLLELGERELAVGAFSGALRSHEAYADAHYHLARTLDDLQRSGEALPHWQRFAELSPESPWAEEARERLGAGI